MKNKVVVCRACGSNNISSLEIVKQFYLMNIDRTVTIPYSVCIDCQFIFQGEYVGDSFLDYHYKNSTMNRRVKPTLYEEDQYERRSKFLDSNLLKFFEGVRNKNVLEIGSDTGGFLAHLHNKYKFNCFFDEKSEEAREIALSNKVLEEFDPIKYSGKMDIVILMHVFEHIYDIEQFIKYVKSTMRSDGYIYMEVPDWSWLDSKTDPLIFEHLSQFSTENLIHLMRSLGWICEALEKSIVDDDPATPSRVQRLIFKMTTLPNLKDLSITKSVNNFYKDVYGRANEAINQLLLTKGKDLKIALYPASHLSFTAVIETDLKNNNIVGFFDIDKKKHGKHFNGIKVYAAEELKEIQPDLIFIFTMAYEREIRESFKSMNLDAEIFSIDGIINNAT